MPARAETKSKSLLRSASLASTNASCRPTCASRRVVPSRTSGLTMPFSWTLQVVDVDFRRELDLPVDRPERRVAVKQSRPRRRSSGCMTNWPKRPKNSALSGSTEPRPLGTGSVRPVDDRIAHQR